MSTLTHGTPVMCVLLALDGSEPPAKGLAILTSDAPTFSAPPSALAPMPLAPHPGAARTGEDALACDELPGASLLRAECVGSPGR